MQNATSAYGKTASTTQSPRELEAFLMMKAATRLQGIHDDWDNRSSDLYDALTYNRKIWTVLVTSATAMDNPLPKDLKENIANLGLFIFNQTVSILAEPQASRLKSLININKELAAGLRSNGQSATAAA